MADAATDAHSGDSLNEIALLVFYWIVAFLGLVGAVALAWRAELWFGLILVGWLVLTIPLVKRTADWLDAQEHLEE